MSIASRGSGREILLTIGPPGHRDSVSVWVPLGNAAAKVKFVVTVEIVAAADEVKAEQKSEQKSVKRSYSEVQLAEVSSWCKTGRKTGSPATWFVKRSASDLKRTGLDLTTGATGAELTLLSSGSTGSVSSDSQSESVARTPPTPHTGSRESTPAPALGYVHPYACSDPDRTRGNTPDDSYNYSDFDHGCDSD